MKLKKIVSACLAAVLCTISVPFHAAAFVKGDADSDGKLTVRDAAFIARCLSIGNGFPSYVDFNGDGVVNIRDAAAIAAHLMADTVNTEMNKRSEAMLALINKERARLGRAPLSLSTKLTDMANVRAKEICEYFSHTRPNGSSCFSILREYGVNYSAAAENIAAGNGTPEATYDQWKNSPGHYSNMIDEDLTEIGIGYYYNKNSEYKYYWVQLFRRP